MTVFPREFNPMRIFISYSTGDLNLVREIATALKSEAGVFYWDKDKVPGEDAWQTIFQWIDLSDIVIAVITDKTVSRAMSVGQEIGRAKTKNKTIIPLVGQNVSVDDLGCLRGVTYQRISERSLVSSLQRIQQFIVTRKRQQSDQAKALLIVSGLLLALLFLASSE